MANETDKKQDKASTSNWIWIWICIGASTIFTVIATGNPAAGIAVLSGLLVIVISIFAASNEIKGE
ncbi:hypothetical protein BMS3Abin15_00632 [bacterium BMS3Abin15]|nr:hypothetical protein BMS3Abin15_00632 [bacterium BMS3Abin15]HDH07558.1 hypothetical protein [Candidatus Moranbacteria bacterium]HDZ85303.1 hypothetical protein [Candidatus Moranbacteria bacterium]